MAKRSYAMQEVQQKLEVAVPAMFQKDDVSNLGFLFGVITLEPIEGNSPAIHALHAVMHVAQIWCCSCPFSMHSPQQLLSSSFQCCGLLLAVSHVCVSLVLAHN